MNSKQQELFWSQVQKSTSGCWNWVGPKNRGYGEFYPRKNRGSCRAHRVSYELANGPITAGQLCCHHCDNRACVNPEHLFLGSAAENSADMVRKRRQMFGEAHVDARLTDEIVQTIRAMYATGRHSQTEIAKLYGVSSATIWKIVHRQKWKHVP